MSDREQFINGLLQAKAAGASTLRHETWAAFCSRCLLTAIHGELLEHSVLLQRKGVVLTVTSVSEGVTAAHLGRTVHVVRSQDGDRVTVLLSGAYENYVVLDMGDVPLTARRAAESTIRHLLA